MQEVIFIQIGSNVGVMASDPLCALILQGNWRGVLIEPVPKIFEKLKKNYAGNPNLYFENVAISDTRKTCEFYIIDENAEFFKKNPHLVNEIGGPYGDLVGSLDPHHALKCKRNLTNKEIKTIQVPCVTLQDIVDKYKFERIDVLHIDAEGHDAVILRSIDFKRIQPKFIMFEHVHTPLGEYLACLDHLASFGYSKVYSARLDTIVSKNAEEFIFS
jgi:FkbM family methyltransferase